jgi:Condensation domain
MKERYPLSFGQERLWFLERLVSGSAFYHLSAAMRVTGPLRRPALQQAVAGLLARHQVLCMRIETTDGVPAQVPVAAPALEILDLSGGSEERAMEAVATRASRPFRLDTGPLVRPYLLRLGPAEHVLVITVHHMVADAWSFGILFRELWALYDAAVAGQLDPLPPLTAQYGDYAVRQRAWLADERLCAAETDFWCGELAGAPAALELPADRPRPAVSSYRGGRASFRVDPTLTRRLRLLARQHRATLFSVSLAAFGVLLARWSGEPNMLIGAPVAGRGRRELEGLIGFFVNTMAIRVDGSDDPAFSELLRRVHQTVLRALAHQDMPFEMLVERLRPERDLSRNPLVQVMFQVDSTRPDASARPAGITTEWLSWGEHSSSHFDLSVLLAADGGGLSGGLTYATDLFDHQTIERVAGFYVRLLSQVTAEPSLRISELTLGASVRLRAAVYNASELPYGCCLEEQGDINRDVEFIVDPVNRLYRCYRISAEV